MSKKKRIDTSDERTLTGTPFSALGSLLRDAPEGPAPEEAPPPGPDTPKEAADRSSRKVVIRREKKGRGGKTATVIEGLPEAAAELERVVRDLRARLGCGGQVEGNTIVLHGAQTERVKAWLEARGFPRIVVAN